MRCLNKEVADDSATTSFNRSGADLTFSNGGRRDKPPKQRGSYRSYVSHKDLEPNNSAKARKKPSYIVNSVNSLLLTLENMGKIRLTF